MENQNKKQEEKSKLGYIRGYKKKEDKTPKVEARPEFRNKRVIRTWRYNSLILIVLSSVIIFIVVALVYALFIFFHGSVFSNIAGVHISENLKEAAYQLTKTGTITGNEPMAGYEKWSTYRNNSYEFKYPDDWELKSEGAVSVRSYNRKVYGYFDSLAVVVNFKTINNLEKKTLEAIALENVKTRVVKRKIGANEFMRTGKISMTSSFSTDTAYVSIDDCNVLEIQAVYYNNDVKENELNFEKILSSIKFL